MSIRFHCENSDCGRELAAPDGAAGKKARCPHCGKVQIIPEPAPAGASPFSAEGGPPPASAPGGGKPVRACTVCGTIYPADQTCPYCRQHKKTYAHERRDVRKLVKVVVLLAALGGVVLAAILGIKSYQSWRSKQPQHKSYLDTVFGAKHMAEATVSMDQLRQIRDGLERYFTAFGDYPVELKELADNGTIPGQILYAPDSSKQAYAYIRGQNPRMDGNNVLVYEEKPIHNDLCNVLRLDGRIQKLTPEQLEEALKETRKGLGQ